MRKRVLQLWLGSGLLLVFLASVASAQSLGDVAREVRKEKRAAAAKKYDNDNLPTNAVISIGNEPANKPAETAEQGAGEPPAGEPPAGDQAKSGAGEPPKPAGAEAKKKANPEEERLKLQEEWRKRLEDQKNSISLLERELDILQREYRLRAAAFYSDAGNQLRNQKQWADDDRNYRTQIDAKQKAIEAAKQKLADMQEEARKAGMPAAIRE